MIAVKEVVGIKEFKTSDGKVGRNIYYTEPFSDYDKNNSNATCVGMRSGELFTYMSLNGLKVGDKFKALYGDTVINGRALLEEIVVIK